MTEVKNQQLKPHYASDFFKLVNDASDADRPALIKQYFGAKPYDMLLWLAFNPAIKLDLPPGAPPFKRDEKTHPDLMAPLSTQIGYLKACVNGQPSPKYKKEKIFTDVCEAVPPADADLLIACKDRIIESLYPNITRAAIGAVFPAYVG